MTASQDLVRRRQDANPELLALLESVEFGGSGLRYRRKALADTLGRAGPTEFLYVDSSDAVVAAYALTQTDAFLAGRPLRAVYRGLLAVAPEYRRRGLGRRLVAMALDQQHADRGAEPLVSFGLVEAGNEASLGLLEAMGATDAGGLCSQLVYRQWPRPSGALRPLDYGSQRVFSELLGAGDRSRGLAIRTSEQLPAFGFVVGDALAAAARVGIATIDLGPGGPVARFMHRHAYARFRALGKRYNRRALRYLTIHDPVVAGDPAYWRAFTDALLAHHDAHMALFTLDPRSDIAIALNDAGVLGRFARATRQELRLMVSAWNLDEGWLERLRSKPTYGGPVY